MNARAVPVGETRSNASHDTFRTVGSKPRAVGEAIGNASHDTFRMMASNPRPVSEAIGNASNDTFRNSTSISTLISTSTSTSTPTSTPTAPAAALLDAQSEGWPIGRNQSYLYPLSAYVNLHPYKFGPDPVELYGPSYYNPCYLYNPIAKQYYINRDCAYDKKRHRYYPNY